MDPKQQKAQLRQDIQERLSRMSDRDRDAESRSVCRRILEALPQGPLIITAYYPLKSEPNLQLLFQELRSRQATIYLPCLEKTSMVFRELEHLKDLSIKESGIPQPPSTAPLLDPQTLQIALIPGRAFDRKGNRLGRGNGGFDIWIRKQRQLTPSTQFWGIAYECQLIDQVPAEAHDERVDAVVTARGMLH